ncbi:MAG TPA: 16S rRNA (cytosine(967)-C(5))-methyltransferase RsmB [Candidatus Sulfotelmatobacter sp.]|nr:16S rRNA (cytosine(967)-C(5))-methyltransferase RsmB [Candidatus Sulfotelmatobacter sp.]
MSASAARKIAFEALRRVEAEGAYASDVLHAELGAEVKLADAALATELTLGVLRWRRLLDFLLDQQLKKPVATLDLAVAIALRMGLYQLRYLGKIPARAAVNESVELVKLARKSSAASLVNAVLRRLSADARKPAEEIVSPEPAPADRLAIIHSHPTWMVKRWLARLGEERTVALLHANNRAPRLSCVLHAPERRDEILRSLEKAGLRIEPGTVLAQAFAVCGGSPAMTEAFRKGWISIQDEASQAVPLLLDVQAGDRVLDLCAAPGGKTAPLARAAGGGLVVAADRHAHRLRAMRAQFERLDLTGVSLVELDATRELPFRAAFNKILVDAPCSGTGTLARHPEIRWRLKPKQLAEFHQLQVAMLREALENLAPRGRLVYSTCSMEPEENEEAIEEVLDKAQNVRRVSQDTVRRALEPHLALGIEARALLDSLGQFRTFPGEHRSDGFFAALLHKE